MKTAFANPLHASELDSVTKKVRHIAAPASRSVTSDHRPVGISQSADQPDGVGAARSHRVELLWQNWLYAVGWSTVPMFQLEECARRIRLRSSPSGRRIMPTPRAISVIAAGGSDWSSDGLCELRPAHAVGDGFEPLDRLSAEDESDVPRRDFVAPTGHRRGGDFSRRRADSPAGPPWQSDTCV
jgi:hypothetical protein